MICENCKSEMVPPWTERDRKLFLWLCLKCLRFIPLPKPEPRGTIIEEGANAT